MSGHILLYTIINLYKIPVISGLRVGLFLWCHEMVSPLIWSKSEIVTAKYTTNMDAVYHILSVIVWMVQSTEMNDWRLVSSRCPKILDIFSVRCWNFFFTWPSQLYSDLNGWLLYGMSRRFHQTLIMAVTSTTLYSKSSKSYLLPEKYTKASSQGIFGAVLCCPLVI